MLRRAPKPKSFLGVDWTLWSFPSMVAASIFRRFFKKPENFSPERSSAIKSRLATAYFLSVWTLVGALIYTVGGRDFTNTMSMKDKLISDAAINRYGIHTIKRVTYDEKSGFVVKDVTDTILTEEKKAAD